MNHAYQPSGKISPLFWPAAAAMAVITAAAALLCAFGVQAAGCANRLLRRRAALLWRFGTGCFWLRLLRR